MPVYNDTFDTVIKPVYIFILWHYSKQLGYLEVCDTDI